MSYEEPKIDDLEDGIFHCPNCSLELDLEMLEPLELTPCPNCQTLVFAPMELGDYWLYKPLGAGGMGAVYKALSVESTGEYALKVLPADKRDDQSLIDTLLEEGNIGHDLGSSDHIIEVIECGDIDGEYYMASEFIDGDRLDTYISEHGAIPEKEALDIALQVLDGEMHIYNNGYLFRDLKPENIMREPDGNVRIYDYGLCQTIEKASTPHSGDALEGSPFYLPPERVVGAPEGEYSEIYSLGMCLYYLLTGKTYYSEGEVKDLIVKHVSSLRIQNVGTRLKHCSPKTVAMLDKMIARVPNDRYHNFETLLHDMEQAYEELDDALLHGPSQEDFSEASEKKSQKSRLIKLIGVAAVLAIIAIGYYSYLGSQEKHLKEKALKKTEEQLNISPDVAAPDKSIDEVEKLVSERVVELVKNRGQSLPSFNTKEEYAKVCKQLSVGINVKNKATKSISELNKLIYDKINDETEKEIEHKFQNFPANSERQKVAKKLNIKLPATKPKLTAKQIKALFLKKIDEYLDKKYSSKSISDAVIKINEMYKPYNLGDKVVVYDAGGNRIEGKYEDRNGAKLKVGGVDVRYADLPDSVRTKFNPSLCINKATATIKRLKESLNSKREETRKAYISKNEKSFYSANGYTYVKKSKALVSYHDLIEKELKKARNRYKSSQKKNYVSIRKKISANFDRDKFYMENAYRKVDGEWYSETDAAKLLFSRLEKKYKENRSKTLIKYKKQAEKQAEEAIPKHGYIFYKGKWEACKDLFDRTYKINMMLLGK